MGCLEAADDLTNDKQLFLNIANAHVVPPLEPPGGAAKQDVQPDWGGGG